MKSEARQKVSPEKDTTTMTNFQQKTAAPGELQVGKNGVGDNEREREIEEKWNEL